jgi:hypothetical protein
MSPTTGHKRAKIVDVSFQKLLILEDLFDMFEGAFSSLNFTFSIMQSAGRCLKNPRGLA